MKPGRNWGVLFQQPNGTADSEGLDRRVAILGWLFLAFVAGLSFLYLMQAKDISSVGYEIREMELERTKLLEQNAQLSLEIAELQDLSRVKDRAKQLGFGPPEKMGYIQLSGLQGR